MKDQPCPNLASRSEVVLIYKCPQKFWDPLSQIWGTKNTKFWTNFSVTSALDTAYLRNETSHRETKMPVSIYIVSPTSWPTFRGFPLSMTFPWTMTHKRLRSVCLLWPNIWWPLHCNHQSCNISSCSFRWLTRLLMVCILLSFVGFAVKHVTKLHLHCWLWDQL